VTTPTKNCGHARKIILDGHFWNPTVANTLGLILTKQRDTKPYPVFVFLPSFRTNILEKFVVNFVLNEAEEQRGI
jgi:hypothetical protein